MRVIAGEFRSRKLISLPGEETRPTPDRLRETLFSILLPRLRGARFLDAYAGTGAVGIEALSRGAAHAIFLENNKGALDVIRRNLETLGILNRGMMVSGHVLKSLPRQQADIVFLDPPYDMPREYRAVLRLLGDAPPQLAIVQHSFRQELDEVYGQLARYRQVRQGDNVLSFYEEKPGQTLITKGG